ncbi:hypothetical protein HPB48_026666 [Haemaphysalis longicornis]|uniref:CCHC-type domain-containing protein n=1 Tax=Haemaphysalis longicornis TaxID=44386 RepID=A0A9J6H1Q6_HAELO|nr:hypothetical protein HPB48_026666 [Haemaphysalis longicornis]
MIVNQRNPKALEAKRIKNTTTVVVLFDGMKVPNYVICGVSMLRCTLYKRQTDVCYACGGLGHRADVCPNPNKRVCRGCGLVSPPDDHQCSPKCALCGGPHPTADRTCKERFQVPYVVRRRRRRRRKRVKKSQQQLARRGPVKGFQRGKCSQAGAFRHAGWPPARPLQGPRSHQRALLLPGTNPGSTYLGGSSQAEASGAATRGNAVPLPEHREDPRVAKLIQENACLKAEIQQLRADLESFRKHYSSQAFHPNRACATVHFYPDDIAKTYTHFHQSEKVETERGKWSLVEGAVPKIFPTCSLSIPNPRQGRTEIAMPETRLLRRPRLRKESEDKR